MSIFKGACFVPGLVAGLVLLCGVAAAQEEQHPSNGVLEKIGDEIEAYCGNIADDARDQRYALQKKNLEELRKDIDARVAVLEARRAEFEDWLTRRNEFLEVAEDGLVEVYGGMRADAAAERLELIGPEIAAAIVMKLDARVASEILNEMEPRMAAMLTSVIASAADETTSRNPS